MPQSNGILSVDTNSAHLSGLLNSLKKFTNDTIRPLNQTNGNSPLIHFLNTCIENNTDISTFKFNKKFQILSTFSGLYTHQNFQDYVTNFLIKNGVSCVRYSTQSFFKHVSKQDSSDTITFFQPVAWVYTNDTIKFSLISARQTNDIWEAFFSQEIELDSRVNHEDLKQKLIPLTRDGLEGSIPFSASNIPFFDKIIYESFERTVAAAKSRLESV